MHLNNEEKEGIWNSHFFFASLKRQGFCGEKKKQQQTNPETQTELECDHIERLLHNAVSNFKWLI